MDLWIISRKCNFFFNFFFFRKFDLEGKVEYLRLRVSKKESEARGLKESLADLKSENYTLKHFLKKKLKIFKDEKEVEYKNFKDNLSKKIQLHEIKLKKILNFFVNYFQKNSGKSDNEVFRLKKELEATHSRIMEMNIQFKGQESKLTGKEKQELTKLKGILSIKGNNIKLKFF